MKTPELGTPIIWRNEPAKIVAIAEGTIVFIESDKVECCAACGGVIPNSQLAVSIDSPLYKEMMEQTELNNNHYIRKGIDNRNLVIFAVMLALFLFMGLSVYYRQLACL